MCGSIFGGGKQAVPAPVPMPSPPPTPTYTDSSSSNDAERRSQLDKMRQGLASTIKSKPQGPTLTPVAESGKNKLGI